MTTFEIKGGKVFKVNWTPECDGGGFDFDCAIDVTNQPMSVLIPHGYEHKVGIKSAEWRYLDKNLLCNYLN